MAEKHNRGAVERAARALKLRIRLLQAVWKDPRTPWYARAVLGAAVAYAVSPIDLIPDFIPVLGLLDDLVVLPAMFWVAMRLVPRSVREEHWRRIKEEEAKSEQEQEHKPERKHGGGEDGR
jgi:uncharacterized membrane protein YkvA (DUF1232 family)